MLSAKNILNLALWSVVQVTQTVQPETPFKNLKALLRVWILCALLWLAGKEQQVKAVRHRDLPEYCSSVCDGENVCVLLVSVAYAVPAGLLEST